MVILKVTGFFGQNNLKLQKLVYYAQGFHLGMFGKPFFDDKVEALEDSPGVRELSITDRSYGAYSCRWLRCLQTEGSYGAKDSEMNIKSRNE